MYIDKGWILPNPLPKQYLKQDFGPVTPEEAIWRQATEKRLHVYTALRPDSFSEWSVKDQMEELSREDTAEMMRFWYEEAVDEQKRELREYKKKVKAQTQLSPVETIPLTIEYVEKDLPRPGSKVRSLL